MRPVLYLCLTVAVFHGVIHCDHRLDHGQNGDHPIDLLEKEQHSHKHHKEPHDHTAEENVTCHKTAAANAEFAFNFYKQLAADENAKNIFFSPASISTAFAMLSLGAKSTTHSQIMEGLGFNLTDISDEEIHAGFHHLIHTLNNPKSELQLSTGNALFIQEALKALPKFLEDVKNYYGSEAFATDFKNEEEAKQQINGYVEKKTHGKIVDLLSSLDHSTVMVLVNYIYFKGKWEKQFDPKQTIEGDFFVDETTVVKVPMMRRYTSYRSWKDPELSCAIVELPYVGNASAFLILPDKGKLKQVEDGLSIASLEKWRRSFWNGIVNLHVPKFSISATIDLKEELSKMGITEVFTDQADLSGITGHHDLKVSKAVHKAVLSIDEKGAEAAAATGMEMIKLSFVFPTKFNRPFLILIYDHNTKIILFLGRIANPTLA